MFHLFFLLYLDIFWIFFLFLDFKKSWGWDKDAERETSSRSSFPRNLLDIEEPESTTIDIEKEKWKKIKEEKGVKGIGVIGFGEIGPYLDTYTRNESSSLLEKLKKDPGLVTELSIIAKHTSEFKTREGEKS